MSCLSTKPNQGVCALRLRSACTIRCTGHVIDNTSLKLRTWCFWLERYCCVTVKVMPPFLPVIFAEDVVFNSTYQSQYSVAVSQCGSAFKYSSIPCQLSKQHYCSQHCCYLPSTLLSQHQLSEPTLLHGYLYLLGTSAAAVSPGP